MKKPTRLSQLASRLDEEQYKNLDTADQFGQAPTPQQIDDAVFAKLSGQKAPAHPNHKKPTIKETIMKRKSAKIAIAAAAICVFCTTAIAATGGLDYFKSLFGDTAPIEQNITSPMVSVEDQQYKVTLESLLTDGYKTDAIVSVEALKGPALPIDDQRALAGMFTATFNDDYADTFTTYPMPEFSGKNKTYVHLEMSGFTDHTGSQLAINFQGGGEPLQLTTELSQSLANKVAKVNYQVDDSYTVETVQVSPLGALIIGSEKAPKGGLPCTIILLKMQDGSTEELMNEYTFDSSADGTAMGGGSISFVEDPATGPLVNASSGSRTPDGKAVANSRFCRSLDLEKAVAIVIDGQEFPLQ